MEGGAAGQPLFPGALGGDDGGLRNGVRPDHRRDYGALPAPHGGGEQPGLLPAALCGQSPAVRPGHGGQPPCGPVRPAEPGGALYPGPPPERPVQPQGVLPLSHVLCLSGAPAPGPPAFGTQLLVMALCTLAAVAALAAHARWVRRPKSGVQNARESVAHLADLLERMAEGERGEDLCRALYSLEKTLHALAHSRRTSWSQGEGEHIFNLLGTLGLV